MASLFWPELIIEIYFLLDYLFFLLLAENKLSYMFCLQSLITYVSVIPQILITSNIVKSDDTIQLYELCYWKVFRLFSVYRMSRIFIKRNNTLARIYFQLVFWLMTLLLMFTFTMLMVENRWCIELIERKFASNPYYEPTYWETKCPKNKYVFHTMLYFSVVTVTTTGYGDISPVTIPGMLLFILFFTSLLVIVIPIY